MTRYTLCSFLSLLPRLRVSKHVRDGQTRPILLPSTLYYFIPGSLRQNSHNYLAQKRFAYVQLFLLQANAQSGIFRLFLFFPRINFRLFSTFPSCSCTSWLNFRRFACFWWKIFWFVRNGLTSGICWRTWMALSYRSWSTAIRTCAFLDWSVPRILCRRWRYHSGVRNNSDRSQ